MAVPAAAWSAQSGDVSAARPAEYMIYQYPDVALVVKINAPEVPVSSRIYGPEGALIKASGIPSGRIGPLFQFIGAVDTPRQLMIKISPEQRINRSAISMELIQLPAWERNSAAMIHGYSLLSQGSELDHSNDTTTWSMKAYTLRSAAEAFRAMGWEEMRLWSELQAAHLVLHKLNDELLAIELAHEIQASARKAGFELIELGALILGGDALMSTGAKSGGRVGAARFEQIHGVMDRVVLLAGQLNLKSEQARALFNDGLAYEQQDQPDAAIGQFQRALDVSQSADNPELVNLIRSTAASTYESLGSNADAIGMLEDIGGDLGSDASQEVTDNLFEKGRILNVSFRYPEAAHELGQALNLLQSSTDRTSLRGAVGLALAWSWYSMGDRDQAASLILESIPRTVQSRDSEALTRAYSSLGNVFRERKDFQKMALYRGKQEALASSELQRSEFAFESALDAWSRDGARSREARERLMQVRQNSDGGGLSVQRADLYLCLLKIEQEGRGGCAPGEVSRSLEALRNSGIPRLAMESGFVAVKILRREGRDDEALVEMEKLIGDILFFRQTLPGVLGAWYWQTKGEIFDEYMAITLARSATDVKRVLLALDHIRSIESGHQSLDGDLLERGQEDALRSLIARREAASGTEAEALGEQANRALLAIPKKQAGGIRTLTRSSLDQILAGLAPNESLLTFHLGKKTAYLLTATSSKVSMFKLPESASFSPRLIALREQIQKGLTSPLPELDALGRDLLGPVADRLTKKIYLLPAGALNGFPLDVLRLKGKFIAEGHQVVNLMSLSSADALHPSLPGNYRESVFLAGNPQTSQELFSYDVQVSPEVSAVTDRFVGPGLHVVQGVALRPDEFQDTRFAGAGLIHLAIPGNVDLADPDKSGLLMSRAGEESTMGYLAPAEIIGLRFSAGLAVLSQTQTSGAASSDFGNRLGFVSDFLEAGVNQVVASMWVAEGVGSMAFVAEFYDNLEAGKDVSDAFFKTRNQQLEASDERNLNSWAGFQLFIR